MNLYAHCYTLLTCIACLRASAISNYILTDVLDCLRSDLVQDIGYAPSDTACAYLCDTAVDCQAFVRTALTASCRLYVFNKCSKSVRYCNCTRRAAIFLKQQARLPPGSLCPEGFKDDFCGVKYRLFNGTSSWTAARAKIEAEPGLVIAADVMDSVEMAHIRSLFTRDILNRVYLGGSQAPGSAEPAGGWYWVSCKATINMTLFSSGQPDNGGGYENVVITGTQFSMLNDASDTSSGVSGMYAECVSPF